jgi:hypothetical protein
LRKTEEKNKRALEEMSLEAGSTSLESQPLFLGFVREVDRGRSYGVGWGCREALLRNFPPVPLPPPSYEVPSPDVVEVMGEN